MFWIVLLTAGFAATFATLGIYIALFNVLKIALIASLCVIGGFVSMYLWRKLFGK